MTKGQERKIVEELLKLIQTDPQLWEIVEQLKHQDKNLSEMRSILE